MRGNDRSGLAVLLGVLAIASVGATARAASCPTEVEPLAAQLLQDLPSYANRTIRRAVADRADLRARYVIVAGGAEYEPLPAGSQEYQPLFPGARQDVEQFFFTTLEQQYSDRERQATQNFHWLLLARTPERGWDVLAMFSRWGTLDPEAPPGVVRESTDSAIANGIRLWLRDCEAGALR